MDICNLVNSFNSKLKINKYYDWHKVLEVGHESVGVPPLLEH